MNTLLDFMDATAARDEAIALVAANAEEACPGFAEAACAFVLDMLRTNGPTSGETLTDACVAAGIKAHDSRAMGGVFMRLSRRKLIEKAGTCQRRKGHGTGGGNIWRLASNGV